MVFDKAIYGENIETFSSSQAILDMLGSLTDRFQEFPQETTDMDWTAFRALAKSGAAEGIIRSTCTYVDADGPSTEYFLVRGNYISAMPYRPFLTTEPFEKVLLRARLTTTGIQWAKYLSDEKTQPVEKVHQFVLQLLLEAEAVTGSVQRVDKPEIVKEEDIAHKAQLSQSCDTVSTNDQSEEANCKLEEIIEMLNLICTGALLQVGHCRLKPNEVKDNFQKLPPSRRKAWMQWFTASQTLNNCTDHQAYEWNKKQLESGDVLIPFESWRRYIRQARNAMGLQKNSTAKPILSGKSIISSNDVEPEYYSPKE